MSKDVKDVKTEDDTLLLVSGKVGDKEYVKKLSNAISQVYHKHKAVKLRCVGAAAVNNAVKAFIISKGESQKRGDSLLLDPSFTTVSFHGEEKTGIILEVKE